VEEGTAACGALEAVDTGDQVAAVRDGIGGGGGGRVAAAATHAGGLRWRN